MRKEVLFAVIVGIALGATIGFGVWRANIAFGPTQNPQPSPKPEVQASITQELLLTQPETGTVISESKVTLKGSTLPLAKVVILGSMDETIIEAGADGSFEEEVNLAPGPNEISIVAFDKNGQRSEQKLALVYSSEFPEENNDN